MYRLSRGWEYYISAILMWERRDSCNKQDENIVRNARWYNLVNTKVLLRFGSLAALVASILTMILLLLLKRAFISITLMA